MSALLLADCMAQLPQVVLPYEDQQLYGYPLPKTAVSKMIQLPQGLLLIPGVGESTCWVTFIERYIFISSAARLRFNSAKMLQVGSESAPVCYALTCMSLAYGVTPKNLRALYQKFVTRLDTDMHVPSVPALVSRVQVGALSLKN